MASATSTDPRIARSRAAVLNAVVDLLVEDGLRAVTIDAVVARSKVARATLYRHWSTRRQLIVEAFNGLIPPPPPVPSEGPIEERLVEFLLPFVSQVDEPWVAALPALLDAARHDPDLAAFIPGFVESRRAPLRQLLHHAVDTNELSRGVDTDLAMAQLAGPIFYRRLLSHEPVDAALCRQLAHDFLTLHRPNATIDSRRLGGRP
jgi:TetR/AcrR family transcriptional regulator of autoinduction and epiphytic fitness